MGQKFVVAWRFTWAALPASSVARMRWASFNSSNKATAFYNRLAGRTVYRCLCLGFGNVLKECGKLTATRRF